MEEKVKAIIKDVELYTGNYLGDAEKRCAGGGSRIGVARSSESTERHSVERALEREYRLSPLHLSRQLERGFYSVRTGGRREHDFIIKSSRLQDLVFEILKECALRFRMHIERVQYPSVLQVFRHLTDYIRVVVTVVESSGAGKEVKVSFSVLIVHIAARRSVENDRKSAAI